MVFVGTKNTLHGLKTGAPLEHIGKNVVLQAALNLSVNKLREDIVYENANVNMFICDKFIQDRNKEFYPGRKYVQEWLQMEHAGQMLKYFATGDNRPVNGSYFELEPQGKKGKYVMPKYYN